MEVIMKIQWEKCEHLKTKSTVRGMMVLMILEYIERAIPNLDTNSTPTRIQSVAHEFVEFVIAKGTAETKIIEKFVKMAKIKFKWKMDPLKLTIVEI